MPRGRPSWQLQVAAELLVVIVSAEPAEPSLMLCIHFDAMDGKEQNTGISGAYEIVLAHIILLTDNSATGWEGH